VILDLQRHAGNAATTRRLSLGHATLQRFDEPEHKAIGDQAIPGVRFRLSPLVEMTYGDLVAAGDYFRDIDEMASLAGTAGSGKGTIGEVYYTLFVKIRGEDEKRYMGEFYDKSAKEAVDARFYRLASGNISHFPNPRSGDVELDPRTKAKRHTGPGEPLGEAATYRDTHVRAIRRAIELAAANKPVGGALAINAFGDHFLTDAFSAGHLRTPRITVHDWWDRKVPDFYQRFQRWLADTMAEWIDHVGSQPEQAWPMNAWPKPVAVLPGKRKMSFDKVRAALKALPAMGMGDVVATAVHDYDSDRGVIVQIGGKRVRVVGDGKLLPGKESPPDEVKAAKTTMDLAVKAVQASAADVEKAYELGKAGADLDTVVARLTKDGKGLFAAERLVPTPVPDAELTKDDKTLHWSFDTVEELFEDPRMRRAITIFANRKASMFDAVMDNPEFDEVAKQGLQVKVARRMSSTDPNVVIGLFKEILAHHP
jgi:hypothetical protein